MNHLIHFGLFTVAQFGCAQSGVFTRLPTQFVKKDFPFGWLAIGVESLTRFRWVQQLKFDLAAVRAHERKHPLLRRKKRVPTFTHDKMSANTAANMSAVGFEPTRSYLQWILSPPP